jgi:hypothetical protein
VAAPRTAEPHFEQRAAAVFATLRQPAPKPWQRGRPDPELRKLLSRIYAAIVQAQRLYQGNRFDETQKARLRELLALTPPSSTWMRHSRSPTGGISS